MTRVRLIRESLLVSAIAFLGVGTALLATALASFGIGAALLAGRRRARVSPVTLQPIEAFEPAPSRAA
jgi:hypothetical protein